MTDSIQYWAVVPAAGIGHRMGADIPKQYLELGGKTVLEHTLDALYSRPELDGLVLVVDDQPVVKDIVRRYTQRKLILARGGQERCHSVLNGLQALHSHANADDWVLVHDAARPCVRFSDLGYLLETLSNSAAGGLLGLPVCDTMKRVDADGRISATVERAGMWRAFTPQMFRFGPLEAALHRALADGFEVTDEASAMEHAGHCPLLVEGHADNIKITRPEDLPLAEYFLAQQGRL